MNFEKNINNEKSESERKKELFLENFAFNNFAQGFEAYQEMLKSTENKKNIITRMRDELYKKNETIEMNDELRDIVEMLEFALDTAEAGEFNKEFFAEKIVDSCIAETFLKKWNLKEGDTDDGMSMLNSVLAFREDEENNISVHTKPANIDPKSIGAESKKGLHELAKKLKEGELDCSSVTLKSWLFNKERPAVANRYLGKEIEIEDVSEDDPELNSTQSLAMQYNSKALKNFLETGEKPNLGKVVFSKNEFIKKFS